MVVIGDVRCKSKNDRCPARRGVTRIRKVKSGVQFHIVARWNFCTPLHRVIGGRRGWARFGDRLRCGRSLRAAGARRKQKAKENDEERTTFHKQLPYRIEMTS